ncbi:MAG: GNAT family N-acetyltransferase [Brumimicrobium sp.]
MLQGDKIFLRQVDEADVNKILLWENDIENWRFSDSIAPFSLIEIQEYVRTASQIYQNQQLRMMICLSDSQMPIGTIDLYEVNFKHQRAGVGILIYGKEHRGKGYASESLKIIEKYAKEVLGLTQLFCDIHADNKNSIELFLKNGFEQTGRKKNWFRNKNGFMDVLFYQKFI